MLNVAPEGFDVAALFEGIYCFQRWEIFPGIWTDGPKDVVANLAAMDFPSDLTGMRVLDIAPWNGLFSFECVRRGAREVVSLGPENPDLSGYNRVVALLGIDNVRYIQASVYDLTPELVGSFDVVMFLGLIYHLRHPLLALDRAYDVCNGKLFIDTPFIDNVTYDKTLSEEARIQLVQQGRIVHQLPMLYFTPRMETGDPFNWFMPNLKAFRAMVESAGFDVLAEADDGGGWAWLSADKGERYFEEGLEGYNAGFGTR